MRNPLNDVPPDLTQEALEDKKIFHAAIAGAKGKQRRDMIVAYCDRYKEVPHLEDRQARPFIGGFTIN